MTIKEMETASGMTRANIRFYESEGLLNPDRRSNGYRDYTEEDLEILERIKLLRALHISLEEIKAMQAGEQTLPDVLRIQINKMQTEKEEAERVRVLCEKMQSDGVRYHTLNARHYLGDLEQTSPCLSLPEEDSVPMLYAPFRRFFARFLDAYIYLFLWDVFLLLVLHINTAFRSRLWAPTDMIVVILLTFLLEPLQLSLFGTTVGKSILGLRVTSNFERRLTYQEAFSRTKTVFFLGLGLCLPIWNLIRLWKSYKAYSSGETLEWDYDSTITLKDRRQWRIFAFIGAHVVIFILLTLAMSVAELPKHRGDISVAQFCENYNRYAKFYNLGSYGKLDSKGHWMTEEDENTHIVYIGGHIEPHFFFTEENDIMTGMAFSLELSSGDESSADVPFHENQLNSQWVPSYADEMILSIFSFVRAQGRGDLSRKEVTDIITQILDSPFESFSFTVDGISIDCTVSYSGYTLIPSMGMLWREDDRETSYSFSFSMYKL